MPLIWSHTAYPQELRFGPGAADRLRPLLKDAGSRRTLVLTSPSVAADAVIEGLGRSVVSVFRDAQPHVPVPTVRAAVQLGRSEQIDTLVSIGGGSVVDLAKAVLFFLEQEAGTPGVTFADRPLLTHVAVPTTLAGAECSPIFAMTDPAARHKQEAVSPTLAPRWVVYDTTLIGRTPGSVLAASGMTALGHAIGAVLTPAGPEAEALGAAALGRLHGALSSIAEDPEALGAVVEASALAARAAANSRPQLASAMALLLGGRCGVDHGVAMALVLPQVLRFNADALGARMEQAAALLGEADLAAALDALRVHNGLPSSLSALGVQEDDIAAVARLVQQHPAFRFNPRPIGEADVVSLLEGAYA
ncbi:MAG: iron-containing alcohol dehydrogenase [Acidimicrobiales bacterium]|nr:iron-containing alcohol dehydrogenase [Acidimicrobiales bacterium]